MSYTKIEWCDRVWNPIRGCSRVSTGCENCYAERMASRFNGPGKPFAGLASKGHWTGAVRVVEKVIDAPLRWRKPSRVFVNSMSDLFHENLSDEDIDKVFAVMALAPQHTFQGLTKRPRRMRSWFERVAHQDSHGSLTRTVVEIGKARGAKWEGALTSWPLPNVWLGVSVENQETADERMPLLLQTPAAVRFLSCEPLLGPIDLRKYLDGAGTECSREWCGHGFVSWVIVGGESGRNARPMNPQWARDIRDQCVDAGVPFFFKQNGEWVSVSEVAGPGAHYKFPDGRTVRRVGKQLAGRTLDGRTWDEFPT